MEKILIIITIFTIVMGVIPTIAWFRYIDEEEEEFMASRTYSDEYVHKLQERAKTEADKRMEEAIKFNCNPPRWMEVI